ncbi:hypothetical protein OEZ85_000535 [Tetradesmus obliquus]|uniref:rRNA-processing protein EFG1 n=1 Tax=Tetradesmus obliquus TaxID=3088 RepID=A0ABY8UNV5_TETOB|nr:hypothetical protein OEZ85_000535 [Tetradesmus obliquus]
MKHKNMAKKGRLLGPRQNKPQPSGGVQQSGKLRSFKNQIRGIERLLRKEDLEPRVRAAKEQQLQQLKEKQEAQQRSEREKRLATKYHKIRFFERVKVERQIQKMMAKQQQ